MPTVLKDMSMKGRLTLAGAALAVLVIAFVLLRVATQPSYATLMTGLDPARTGKITAALDAQGIPYELQNNGTALGVEKAKAAQARVALASEGLDAGGTAGGGQVGFELLDKQKLGASDFQQKVNYQRALEGEIAKTVGEIQGLSGAKVQLSLPEDELFADEAKPATAAVLLSAGAAPPDAGQVRGIAQLVSSSVEGLKPENVTITDGSGQLLWPQGDGAAGAAGTASKIAAEARYAQGLEASLTAMLARTLGPGRAQVAATADLNADEATEEKLTYDEEGVPVRTSEEEEQLESEGAGGAAAGAVANIAGGAAAGGGGESNYEKNTTETDYNVGKTVRRTKFAPGAVNRLDVAVLVDRTVPPAEVANLRAAIQSAAGLQDDRGDTLEVRQVAFAAPPEEEQAGGPIPADLLGHAKYVALGLAALLFLFFVTRALRRREQTGLADPTWLREIETPRPLAELEAGAREAETQIVRPPMSPARSTVEQLAQQDPDLVAQQVRSWISEDQP